MARTALGLPDDARKYDIAADVLAFLGVQSVELLTNNPAKEDGLRALGVKVTGRRAVVIAANPHSAGYLEAKRSRMAHALPRLALEPISIALAPSADAE